MPKKKDMRPRPPADLPRVRKGVAEAIEAFLMEHYAMKRPPVVAAQLLALICELDKTNTPFPSRADVAAEIGCTVFGIDAALSVALSRGLIGIEMAVSQGNVQQRDSALRHRYYRPSRELAAVFNHSLRRATAA